MKLIKQTIEIDDELAEIKLDHRVVSTRIGCASIIATYTGGKLADGSIMIGKWFEVEAYDLNSPYEEPSLFVRLGKLHMRFERPCIWVVG